MRSEYLLICLAFGISLTLTAVRAEKSVIVVARSASTPAAAHKPKPTTAPLYTSSPRPPIAEAQATAAPTKAPTVIFNAPPQLASTTAKQQVTVENVTAPQPLQTPPTDAEPALVQVIPKQSMPLQVTGLITKNGNIYEVVDKHGIGRIGARQNSDTDSAPYVCNYGAVVIYSDVPCEEVTNVHIGEVHRKVLSTADNKEEQPAEPQQSTAAVQQVVAESTSDNSDNSNNSNNNNNADNMSANTDASDNAKPNSKPNDDDDFADFDETVPTVVKKRRRGNQTASNQRKRNGNRQRPNAVRQGGGKRRRQQAKRQRPQQQQQQQQKRRRQQNNRNRSKQQRKRLQNQQYQQQQKRRRYQNDNGNTQRRQHQRRGNNKRRQYIESSYDY